MKILCETKEDASVFVRTLISWANELPEGGGWTDPHMLMARLSELQALIYGVHEPGAPKREPWSPLP